MRSLVTGATGFIGSHLCDALVSIGHEVIGVDSGVIGNERNISKLIGNPQFKFEAADVIEPFDFGPVDWIFHFASPTAPAETYKHPKITLEVNTIATSHALQLANKYKAKMMFASSIKVKDAITFGSEYIKGKMFGEQYCTAHEVKIARMGNIYGPRMASDDSRVIPTFCRNIIHDEPMNIWGDGSQVDSFCYIQDCIRGLISFMESDVSGVVEFGDPVGITILDLAYTMLRTLGAQVPIMFEQPGGGCVVLCNNEPYAHNRTARALAAKQRKVPDIHIARDKFGWYPRINMEYGIRQTFEYYKSILSN